MQLQDFCTDLSTLDHPKQFSEGLMLLIDKPLEWTSFDVVKKIRSRLQHGLKIKKMKVGHAGTLDPLATGLVMVCTGKATKKIDELMGHEKSYEARVKFGATTASFDLEKPIDQEYPADHITASKIKSALTCFLGEQDQIPPQFSAVKINGKRAYSMARRGEEFEVKSRKVVFHELKVLSFEEREATIHVKCSKGTYIRSFARDLGVALNSGAHLTGLKRTGIGSIDANDAMGISAFDEQFDHLQEKWWNEGLIEEYSQAQNQKH
ncbi:tRNA pseudouridine(55) synthase TruB [Marinilabilia rubra]|uniref:tRNA pseudouridine synthase B n=1 Tax=Marinilabilia rubra TaxID=2162893 RepID=A0A2U2B9J1_9BACT|nr:tRNA pseudouridine(55) synthase TruB [Marinilabilia rubra]PWD99713.1 tRNA pseudouridine(55) synthase TruB [Marinilabilia rubra]